MLATLFLATALTPQAPQGVVINEFAYDDTGTDDYEFVEIYNSGPNVVDISGWILWGEEGDSGGAPNGSLTIGPGAVLAPGQFWLIGDATNFPQANQPLGTVLRLENGPDGLRLTDPAGVYQDGVVWEYAAWTAPVPTWLEGDGIGGDIQLHENPGNFNSVSRAIDGMDTDSNGCDFISAPWTPGTFNVTGYTTLLPYTNDFDDPVGSTVDADFTFSFITGTTQDPAAVLTAIIGGVPQPTQSFPPSPQGGNISTWHDPTGGGDANWLKSFPIADYAMEAYVYLTGPNPNFAATDGEHWVMGVRGSSDSFGEPANVGNYHAAVACTTNESGHTGIAWVCNRHQTTADLYLVDYNDGGGDFVVLAGPIAIQPGVNDGWQRLRLCVQGTDLVANFGGTLGCDDGQRFTASNVSYCASGAYFTYRECVTNNNDMLPLMLDALTVTECTAAAVTPFGTGSPTSVGIPVIGSMGLPTLGNPAFAVTGSNLVPGSNPFCGLVAQLGGPLPGIQIPGAQPGAFQYVNPSVALVAFANASGTAAFPLAMPCVTEFAGIEITTQIIDFDLALPNAIPIGTTNALTLQLGF
ncbi:MAG: lamin tail domain-containing protein [Planctomycetes bacterium]|nr:lamin tail domain-containing protein [Planctomycetota bacterium]